MLRAKLQRAEFERDRYVDVASLVQSGIGVQQKLLAKDSSASQQRIEEHWVRLCRRIGALLVELVLEAPEC